MFKLMLINNSCNLFYRFTLFTSRLAVSYSLLAISASRRLLRKNSYLPCRGMTAEVWSTDANVEKIFNLYKKILRKISDFFDWCQFSGLPKSLRSANSSWQNAMKNIVSEPIRRKKRGFGEHIVYFYFSKIQLPFFQWPQLAVVNAANKSPVAAYSASKCRL